MKEEIEKIALVGYGNVGSHLALAFHDSGVQITHIVSRNAGDVPDLLKAKVVDHFEDIPSDRFVLLCVPDHEIHAVLKSIPSSNPVAYTSGATALESLPQRGCLGVFYPLQTFTKGVELNVFEIPFFIESTHEVFTRQLFNLAWRISRKVSYADSQERKRLHVGAVWVNNFTNHLNHIAAQFLEKHGLDFHHLHPLLKETVRKLESHPPFVAQTGPARRMDMQTIAEHLSMLSGREREIYEQITQNIIETYTHD